MTQNKRFGVIGNPIKHSLSPIIHSQFATQFSRTIDYQRYLLKSDELNGFIQDFFSNNGCGLNVTLPYKQAVIPLLSRLTPVAQLTQSVNTIYCDEQGLLVGDSTDGAGLVLDLQRQQIPITQRYFLIVGAGGASLSIIVALLQAGASIVLHNRTEQKVDRLVERFSSLGSIKKYSTQSFDADLAEGNYQFDAVISSVSEFNKQLMQPLMPLINSTTFCYDLNYGVRAQAFSAFAESSGCEKFSDGLGMLLGQAALSYQRWFGDLPNIDNVSLNEA